MEENTTKTELTFGEQAVGFTFNHAEGEVHKKVAHIKRQYADIIDDLNDERNATDDPEVKRLCSVAITEAQGAQMWAVKAVTWGSK